MILPGSKKGEIRVGVFTVDNAMGAIFFDFVVRMGTADVFAKKAG